MEIYQVLVRNLDGHTRCIRFSSPAICGLDLKQKVCRLTGIRADYIRLATGTNDIYDDTELYAEDFLFRPVCLTSRLCGGKGGFGSLLRGAATKAGQKKTNNFDACRDMSGRRLRHVNAEKKLEEWQAEAKERKLEKLAENFLKKKSKEVKNAKSVDTDKYIKKYREDSAKCVEDVEASVKDAFKLYENSKRKVLPASGPASKRPKIWMGKGKEVDSDSDDEEADDEISVALQKSEPSSLKKDEGCSTSVPVSHLNGESLGGSVQNGLEEVNGNSEQEGLHSSGETDNIAHDIDVSTLTESKLEYFSSKVVNNDLDKCPDVKDKSNDNLAEIVNSKIDQSPEVNFPAQSSQSLVGNESLADEKKVAEILLDGQGHSTHPETNVSDVNSPLDFNHYSTAADMEVLGAERLKVELQARGLKCGGTLQERAARLFLLKTIPLDKLPKKLLAKPPIGVIKKETPISGKTHDIAVNS